MGRQPEMDQFRLHRPIRLTNGGLDLNMLLGRRIGRPEPAPRGGLTLKTSGNRRSYLSNARVTIESARQGSLRLSDRLRKKLPWLAETESPGPTASSVGEEEHPDVRQVIDTLRPRFRWSADLLLLLLVALAVGITFSRSGTDDSPVVAEAVPRISAPVRSPLAFVAVTAKSISRPVGSEVELAVRVSGDRGRPVVDRTVVWRVLEEQGAVLGARAVRTDAQGVAWNSLRLPEETGRIIVVAGAEGTDLPEVRFEVAVLPRNP